MSYIKLVATHWKEIAGFGAVALSTLVHAYQIIVQAGGIDNIWLKFRKGETPTKV